MEIHIFISLNKIHLIYLDIKYIVLILLPGFGIKTKIFGRTKNRAYRVDILWKEIPVRAYSDAKIKNIIKYNSQYLKLSFIYFVDGIIFY